MIQLQMLLLIPVFMRSIYTDLKDGVIENRLLASALAPAVLLIFYMGGVPAVLAGIKASFILVGTLFLLFLAGAVGAGDIKLLALVALLFPAKILNITLASFIMAGLMCVVRMLWRLIRKSKAYLRGETIHFSIPIAAGTLAVLILGM